LAVIAVARFERLFRLAAGLDVDKQDLRRHGEFVNAKLYDLLVRAEATAKTNGRDLILPCDLPITKGLQERMHEFARLDEELDLEQVLETLARHPPLDLDYADDTRERFPAIIGGLSVALARSFRILEPGLKNPKPEHWQRSYDLFNLLL
jgi:hypothetical protein